MTNINARLRALEKKRGQIVEPERFNNYSEGDLDNSLGFLAEALEDITGETIEIPELREVLKNER